jgi:hypothetical protein
MIPPVLMAMTIILSHRRETVPGEQTAFFCLVWGASG